MKSIIVILLMINTSLLFGQSYSFPNHTNYSGNHIKPNNYTQLQLDTQTQFFYDEWKSAYLKNDCGNINEYYIFSGNGSKNVSEAQGYGMMIVAYLAGYDINAKIFFDGLFQFYKSHPSSINSVLMDWQQVGCNDLPSSVDDSASDGDIDIAFALLLAHLQWGSNGAVDYLTEAKIIISAIMQDEVNQSTWTVRLGDWSNANDPNYFYGTRPSDFITDHFKVFTCFNSNWNNVIDTCYSLIYDMQLNYSATTGLIPDFIINVNINPSPAGANYLESPTDGDYSYNACRVPWRLGTDYLISGDIRAKTAIDKINTWLISATNGIVDNISSGYELNGTASYNWNDAAFTGPFTVGAMLNTSSQTWLNSLYENLLTNNDIEIGEYYSNTIKLLSMIVISGNYWIPDCNALNIEETNFVEEGFVMYPNSTTGTIYVDIKERNENIKCIISDINGKTLVRSLLLEGHNSIDISTYTSGIYFISITINNKKITKKIVKE